jgi:segregation and condensation protein B
MSDGMNNTENAILAIIFASEKVSRGDLCAKLHISNAILTGLLRSIEARMMSADMPFILQEAEGWFRIVTKPEYAPQVALFRGERTRKLSPAALETLAIVAAKQPCTREEIETVRGADCEKVLSTLIDAGLVKQVATLRQAGAPMIYSITEQCLFRLGLKSMAELNAVVKQAFQ